MKAIRGSGGVRSSLGYEFMLTDLQQLLRRLSICSCRLACQDSIILQVQQAVYKPVHTSEASPLHVCLTLSQLSPA
jgi:hypothetical protein